METTEEISARYIKLADDCLKRPSPSGSSAKAAPDNRGASQLVRSGSLVSWPSARLSFAPGVLMVGICGHADENIMAIYIHPLPCVAIVLEWRVTKPANADSGTPSR